MQQPLGLSGRVDGVDAYYAGDRDVAIARGSVDDFSLVAQGTSYFDLVLTPNPAGFVYRYLAEDWPLITDEASWPLDLRVELSSCSSRTTATGSRTCRCRALPGA